MDSDIKLCRYGRAQGSDCDRRPEWRRETRLYCSKMPCQAEFQIDQEPEKYANEKSGDHVNLCSSIYFSVAWHIPEEKCR
jgi:hypothetical protein